MCRTACLYDVPRDSTGPEPLDQAPEYGREVVAVESRMSARWPLPFVLVFGLTATPRRGPGVTIDTASPSGKVSPLFYGLMTEEINHAYDGGLYAELVRNRAFLDDAAAPAHWSLVQADGAAATMALDPKEPLEHDHRDESALERHAGLEPATPPVSPTRATGAFRSNPTRATARRSTPRRRPDSPGRSQSRSRATTAGRPTRRRPSPG